jgi:AraC-like DNA-binding protein
MARRMPDNGDLEEKARAAGYHPGELAKACGLAPLGLRRAIHASFGCSPREWLEQLRMKHVLARLLSDQQVKALASEAGFNHVANFSRWFKVHRGLSPSEFHHTHMDQRPGEAGLQGGDGI